MPYYSTTLQTPPNPLYKHGKRRHRTSQPQTTIEDYHHPLEPYQLRKSPLFGMTEHAPSDDDTVYDQYLLALVLLPPVLLQISRLPPQFFKHIEVAPLKVSPHNLTHGPTSYILRRLHQLVTPNHRKHHRTAQELLRIILATVSLHYPDFLTRAGDSPVSI